MARHKKQAVVAPEVTGAMCLRCGKAPQLALWVNCFDCIRAIMRKLDLADDNTRPYVSLDGGSK